MPPPPSPHSTHPSTPITPNSFHPTSTILPHHLSYAPTMCFIQPTLHHLCTHPTTTTIFCSSRTPLRPPSQDTTHPTTHRINTSGSRCEQTTTGDRLTLWTRKCSYCDPAAIEAAAKERRLMSGWVREFIRQRGGMWDWRGGGGSGGSGEGDVGLGEHPAVKRQSKARATIVSDDERGEEKEEGSDDRGKEGSEESEDDKEYLNFLEGLLEDYMHCRE